MGERMSTDYPMLQLCDYPMVQCDLGAQENLLEIGLSVISCIPCICFDCNCTLRQLKSIQMSITLFTRLHHRGDCFHTCNNS